MKENGESTSLQHNPIELESKLKNKNIPEIRFRKFLKLNGERVGEEEGDAYQGVLLEFGARRWICKRN